MINILYFDIIKTINFKNLKYDKNYKIYKKIVFLMPESKYYYNACQKLKKKILIILYYYYYYFNSRN